MDDSLHERTSRALTSRTNEFAVRTTEDYFARRPQDLVHWGEKRRRNMLSDNQFHLVYLAEAIRIRYPVLFTDYAAWARVMLERRQIPAEVLAEVLAVMRDVLCDALPVESHALVREYVDGAVSAMLQAGSDVPSEIVDSAPLADLATAYLGALLRGDRRAASRLILGALEAGTDPREIYLHVFQTVQYEVGRLWQTNRINVGEEHYCTASTQLIMSQLYPRVLSSGRNGLRLVAACVGGDLHEIGLRMVSDFFEMEGWDAFYLGANTPSGAIMSSVIDRKAHLLVLSVTLTPHLRTASELIAEMRREPACSAVRILAGGTPFNAAPGLWRDIGADGWGRDARESVAAAGKLDFPEY